MLLLTPTIVTTAGIFSIIVLLAVTSIFIMSRILSDNSIMDIFYGPIYALSYWATWWLIGQPTGVSVLVGVLVTIWALRLGVRIGRKNLGAPEDPRYAAWRTAWCTRGTLYFIVRSYLQVNVLQGVVIVIVATPLWLVLGYSDIPFNWLTAVGVAVWVVGLLYESVADWQLDRFIHQKKTGRTDDVLLTKGLFRLSRRPNYFGESLVWWGLAGIALGAGWGAWFGLISPILITYIVTKVTGPMLEAQFLERYPKEYQAYIDNTRYFIPGPPRS